MFDRELLQKLLKSGWQYKYRYKGFPQLLCGCKRRPKKVKPL